MCRYIQSKCYTLPNDGADGRSSGTRMPTLTMPEDVQRYLQQMSPVAPRRAPTAALGAPTMTKSPTTVVSTMVQTKSP